MRCDLPDTDWSSNTLVQANGDVQWLQWAYQLQDAMDELFWDDVGGELRCVCGLCSWNEGLRSVVCA
jgi:hypothetical protein